MRDAELMYCGKCGERIRPDQAIKDLRSPNKSEHLICKRPATGRRR